MADKYLINTDNPLDKIVYFNQSNNISNSDGFNPSVRIAHGLPFIPLIFGVWATSSSFNDSRTLTREIEAVDGYVYAVADDTYIYIYSFAGYYDASWNWHEYKTWTRVYAFMPSDSTATVAHTNSSAKTFMVNSDYKYTRLRSTHIVTAPTTQTITHNLGYKPQVMAWEQYQGGAGKPEIQPYNNSFALSPYMGGEGVKVTNNTVVVTTTSANRKVHLRIYENE